MKNKIAFLIICLIFVSLFSFTATASTESDSIPHDTYTYWTGLSGGGRKAVEIKSMYSVDKVIFSEEMNVGEIEAFEDICCDKNGNIYILEGKTSKIIILNKDFNVQNVITEIKYANGENVSFKGSEGIFVDNNNDIYIAAAEQQTVFKVNSNGNYIKEYLLPDSNIIPSEFRYRPIKITVDRKGYVYILSEGSYYGALLYSPDDEFLGFYGANSVTSSITEAITGVFKKMFVNDIKKEQSSKALPYQFTDLVVDNNNFIYTVTGSTKAAAKGQIRKLNPGGKNVLDSDSVNYVDDNASIKIGEGWHGSNLSRIAISGDYIYALDVTYGKIFMYNVKNELMCIFGCGLNEGDQKGSFSGAKAIDVYENSVYVIDSNRNCLTVFKPTEYGNLVMTASSKVIKSDYLSAEDDWARILRQDTNNQLAYRYLAKAEYTKGNYKAAMSYAKQGADREIYGQAFEVYRNKLLKDNFLLIIIIAIVVIVILVVLKRIKSVSLIKRKKTKLMFSTLFHPFESFKEIKYKNEGSLLLAVILLVLYFVTEVLKTTKGGFMYTYFDASSFNALYVLMRTIGIIVLWTITNWAVSTLFGGIGKMKEIFIVACYSLMPLIFFNLFSVLATNVLATSEAQFLDVLSYAFMFYTLVLIAIGTIIIHDFDFGHFTGTTVLTIVGMLIVVFVIFIAWLIIQQLFGFLMTLFNEIIYR